MDISHAPESFRGLLLRHRGRTGLFQRDLATRVGVSRNAVQDWESGLSYPTAERLQALIDAMLEAGGLTAGGEASEARELWAAAQREAPRMHTPFDEQWFARLLAARAAPTLGPAGDALQTTVAVEPGPAAVKRAQDWGEAPDTTGFVGRDDELTLLQHWVIDERCRLVALLGMGGIGKTSLAARLGQMVAPSFERVYWRSLRDAPPVSEWLAGAIGFLSDQEVVPPSAESERIACLLQLLRERRCLLVLDNSETLFEPGQREGRYRTGMAGYGRLLQAIGEASHASCLVLTSREAPPELVVLSGAVRTLELSGLGTDEAQVLLAAKQLDGTSQQWGELNARYGGNGLALKVVSATIRELFGGDIGTFLQEAGDGNVFGGIRRLLTEQVDRSSALEQQVLRLLAVDREPVSIGQIIAELGPTVGRGAGLEAVEALRRRSLVERAELPGVGAFSLQSVVLEYVTDRVVAEVFDELQRGQAVVLREQPLIKAQARDYLRQSQERLIGAPIVQQLSAQRGEGGAAQRLLALVNGWRGRPSAEQGYAPGNLVNLLRLLRGDLRGLDLSRLTIRQAYLAEVDAQDASLIDAHLADTVLAEAFNLPGSVALSSDGALLAAGTSTGQVWLWRVADRMPLWTVQGHTGGIWAIALSADGRLVAGGGEDGTVRLWETGSGRALATLPGHTGAVWGVALSGDGELVASGGGDGMVRLWDTRTAQPIATLTGHTGGVWDVALSSDGELVASGGGDGTVRLWDTKTAEPIATLPGHTGTVRGVAVSADGRLVASGGGGGTVRLWETSSGRAVATLPGHTGTVRGVALSADGQLVASGAGDGTVRLWETTSRRPVATLQGSTGTVRDVALSADGHLVASGGEDGTVRLWETSNGRALATLQGHTDTVWGVALSADGRLVASGGEDGTVRLWETTSRRPVATLHGHAGGAWGVALSADGQLVASGGGDRTVRLWEVGSGRLLATLHGHAGGIRGVALSADDRLVASGGEDGTVRLWEVGSGRPLATLHGHAGGVRGVALSADGQLVASAGEDGTVWLWETSSGRPLATLQGHAGPVYRVALSADGRLVASGGGDGTVRLWDVGSGRPLASMQGQTGGVWGVALSADGQLVVSGGFDGTVRLWKTTSATQLRMLREERRYERLAITGLTGITDAQRAALLALGAVE